MCKKFSWERNHCRKVVSGKADSTIIFFLNACSIALQLIWIKEIDLRDLMWKKPLKQSDFLFFF